MSMQSHPDAQKEMHLEQLMNQYGDSLLRICYLYLKDAALAQDAVQCSIQKTGGEFFLPRFFIAFFCIKSRFLRNARLPWRPGSNDPRRSCPHIPGSARRRPP